MLISEEEMVYDSETIQVDNASNYEYKKHHLHEEDGAIYPK